jgi:hypothetical protein
MSDQKIYRAAMRMIHAFGDNAAVAASMKCDKCLEDSDMDCFEQWKRIKQAAQELLDGTNGTVH